MGNMVMDLGVKLDSIGLATPLLALLLPIEFTRLEFVLLAAASCAGDRERAGHLSWLSVGAHRRQPRTFMERKPRFAMIIA